MSEWRLGHLLAAAAIVSLLLVFTSGRKPAPRVIAAPIEETVAMKKADRIATAVIPELMVPERSIQPEAPTAMPPVLMVQEQREAKPVTRHKHRDDICAKHGMVRVEYRKSWRCLKK